MGPARALGHDVKVAEHDHKLLALAVIQPAAVAVEVVRRKAHLRAEAQNVIEAVLRAASEHGAVLAERLHARDAQQPLKRRDLFIKMIPDPCLVIHIVTSFVYYNVNYRMIALMNGVCTGLSGVIV